jgi:hypothetical protein
MNHSSTCRRPGALALSFALFIQSLASGALARDAQAEFVTVFPGQPTPREKPFVDEYLALNKAIADRGPIDVAALIDGRLPEGTPGVGPVIEATPAMVAYQNNKYDPDNRLYSDADYARELGYANALAFPTYAAHDDTFMVPSRSSPGQTAGIAAQPQRHVSPAHLPGRSAVSGYRQTDGYRRDAARRRHLSTGGHSNRRKCL